MRLKVKISKALILAATMGVMAASNAAALPPGKTGEWKPIDSEKEAKALPKGADIMLAWRAAKRLDRLIERESMPGFLAK
jgi:hypothetical protein